MNWLVPFISNLKGEEGINIKNPTSDHPTLELNIVAGSGINITKSNGTLTISTTKDDDDDNTTTKPTTKPGGGSGSGSGGSGSGGGVGSGGSGGGSGLGGGSGGSGSGLGGGSGGLGSSSSCNIWSDEIDNNGGDGRPDNEGDNCKELNGW